MTDIKCEKCGEEINIDHWCHGCPPMERDIKCEKCGWKRRINTAYLFSIFPNVPKYRKAILDGKTWKRKHRLIHKIEKELHLTEKTTANLLSLSEYSLQEIYDRLKERL